ncbi:hypothetical protein ACIOEX_01690 [Streptomyces sp. NPDC087850]|uniref:hypothetical protein n=1 Tax=Streptomyces sp. NPDC087850 TaxID=3365809 RepID=UPI0037FB749C
MDLHAWITQQADRAELTGRRVTLMPENSNRAISGTVTDVSHGADGLRFSVAQRGVETVTDAATLRRCEADRRILARHRLDPDRAHHPNDATACQGCGTTCDGDWPVTENLNDCPELLDLAHAHGITPDTLAGLDRPQAPEPTPTTGRLGLACILATPPITTSDVPEALRGPNWRPAPDPEGPRHGPHRNRQPAPATDRSRHQGLFLRQLWL